MNRYKRLNNLLCSYSLSHLCSFLFSKIFASALLILRRSLRRYLSIAKLCFNEDEVGVKTDRTHFLNCNREMESKRIGEVRANG